MNPSAASEDSLRAPVNERRRPRAGMVGLLPLLLTGAAGAGAVKLGVEVESDGKYSVLLDGDMWLHSSPVRAYFSHTEYPAPARVGGMAASAGTDELGHFTSKTQKWLAGSVCAASVRGREREPARDQSLRVDARAEAPPLAPGRRSGSARRSSSTRPGPTSRSSRPLSRPAPPAPTLQSRWCARRAALHAVAPTPSHPSPWRETLCTAVRAADRTRWPAGARRLARVARERQADHRLPGLRDRFGGGRRRQPRELRAGCARPAAVGG